MILKINDWIKDRNKIKNHAEPTILINQHDGFLSIHYTPHTSEAKFSIADFNGNILYNGCIKNGAFIKQKCGKLSQGIYNLFIVDGEDIIQKQFRVESP